MKEEEVFKEGDAVGIQDSLCNTWEEGTIVNQVDHPRSYTVQIKGKKVKRRNQIYIRKKRK